MIYKLYNKLLNYFTHNKESNFPKELALSGYYFYHDSDIHIVISKRLYDHDLNLSEFFLNDALNKYHIIDKKILSKVLINNVCILDKLFSNKNILNHTEYKKYYFPTLSSLAINMASCFYDKLNTCIIQSVSYHNNSYKHNQFYVKNYYNKIEKNETLYKLYSNALTQIKFDGLHYYYNHAELYTSIYNLIDKSFFENISKLERHKRNLIINCLNQEKKIYKIEKDGIPYKTYYPFYESTKVSLKEITLNNYVFLLTTKEVNEIVTIILRLFSKETRIIKYDDKKKQIAEKRKKKKYKEEIRKEIFLFFSNNFDSSSFSVLKKNIKMLIFTAFILNKNEKCDIELFKNIIIQKKITTRKVFNQYIMEFNQGNKPKKHTILNSYIKKNSLKNSIKTCQQTP